MSVFLVLGGLGSALAHQDRLLPLREDGTITGLPDEYLPASLTVKRDSRRRVVGAVLVLSGGVFTFPECTLRLFENHPRIALSGSWYHSRSTLPYYIAMKLQDEKERPRSETFAFLFDLMTARPLKLEKVITEPPSHGMTTSRYEPAFENVCPGKKLADGWKLADAKAKR